jgi:hypothetical protein
MFLLACQEHRRVGESGKTFFSVFRRAWSQSVLIAPGPVITTGKASELKSSLTCCKAHSYALSDSSERNANPIKKDDPVWSIPIVICELG